jgi:aminoglycoside phosphotransferase (APT) family kinase protein
VAAVDLTEVPEAQRAMVADALAAAFSPGDVTAVRAVAGGASGALTYRVESAAAGDHLLRVEVITGPLRNPHQYTCLEAAAAEGIAPPVRFVDADAGVLVMRFVDTQPLASFPGGPPALAAAAGDLLGRLHRTVTFPAVHDYQNSLGRLVASLGLSGRVAPGLLDRHVAGFARIKAAYPWDPSAHVAGHNDPNEFNLLSDGTRLWLVDWETANRNDPFVDLATAASHLAATPDLRDGLLRAWMGDGREPTRVDEAQLGLMGLCTQLFAGAILLTIVVDPEQPVHTDLDALTPDEFGAAIARGELVPGRPATTLAFAKLMLRRFTENVESPAADAWLQTVIAG